MHSLRPPRQDERHISNADMTRDVFQVIPGSTERLRAEPLPTALSCSWAVSDNTRARPQPPAPSLSHTVSPRSPALSLLGWNSSS